MAKFCGYCGTAMDDNSAFCPGCGTSCAPAQSASYGGGNQGGFNSGNSNFGGVTNTLTASAGNNFIFMYVGAIVIQIINIILWFVNTAEVSIKLFGEKESQAFSLSEFFDEILPGFIDTDSLSFVSWIMVIISIISLVFLVLPILQGKTDKKNLLIAPRIASILEFLMFIATLIAIRIALSDVWGIDANEFVKVGGTFGGWVLSLLCVGQNVLLTVLYVKVKEAERKKRIAAVNNSANYYNYY